MIGIIILLIILNALYYGYLVTKWNDYTQDGCIGQSLLGVAITIASMVLIFNLKSILGC